MTAPGVRFGTRTSDEVAVDIETTTTKTRLVSFAPLRWVSCFLFIHPRSPLSEYHDAFLLSQPVYVRGMSMWSVCYGFVLTLGLFYDFVHDGVLFFVGERNNGLHLV